MRSGKGKDFFGNVNEVWRYFFLSPSSSSSCKVTVLSAISKVFGAKEEDKDEKGEKEEEKHEKDVITIEE